MAAYVRRQFLGSSPDFAPAHFDKAAYSYSRNLRRMLSGAMDRVSGMVIIVHIPPTKSGKRVMFLTLEDETGLFDVVVFSKAKADLPSSS